MRPHTLTVHCASNGWSQIFEIDWADLLYPGSCLSGSYYDELLLRAFGPLVLVTVVVFVGLSAGMLRGNTWRHSLVSTLPTLLLIAFCLTPSTSANIFATWSCESFELDSYPSNATRATNTRFLRADLSLTCGNSAYNRVETLAYCLVVMWPVGVRAASTQTVSRIVTASLSTF